MKNPQEVPNNSTDVTTNNPLMGILNLDGKDYITSLHLQSIYNFNGGEKYKRLNDFNRLIRSIEIYPNYLNSKDIIEIVYDREEIRGAEIASLLKSNSYNPIMLITASVQAALSHHLDDEISKQASIDINEKVSHQNYQQEPPKLSQFDQDVAQLNKTNQLVGFTREEYRECYRKILLLHGRLDVITLARPQTWEDKLAEEATQVLRERKKRSMDMIIERMIFLNVTYYVTDWVPDWRWYFDRYEGRLDIDRINHLRKECREALLSIPIEELPTSYYANSYRICKESTDAMGYEEFIWNVNKPKPGHKEAAYQPKMIPNPDYRG